MKDRLVVVLDGVSQLEYRRSQMLRDGQRACLDNIDRRMSNGIDLGGRRIGEPDSLQRAQFVALQLLGAIQARDEGSAAAMLAYLANRIPDLKQVCATTRGGLLSIDLVFDRPYVGEAKVEFVKPQKN